MSATAQDEFQARLARIRQQNGQSVMMVGQDEQVIIPRKVHVQQSRRSEIAGNLLYPGSLLGAILLGMVAVLVGHYVRFQLMAESVLVQDDTSAMLLVGGVGLAASFVLSQAFKLTSKEHRSLQGIGVFVMVCTFHNLAHWLPGPMSLAFSPAYVAQTVETTPASSFRLGARYFQLFDTAPASGSLEAALAEAEGDSAPKDEATAPKKLPIVRKGGKIVQGD